MKPIHFIVGCPRSGTYLLSSILDRSGQVAVPTETHFVPLFAQYARLFGDLEKPDARTRLLAAIYAFLEIWLRRADEERGLENIIPHSLLATRGGFNEIVRDSRSYADIVHALFEHYAIGKGASQYGDKSAFF
ncbi:MAG: sulfotransferase, partial [Vicinamibacterales bacterium]|nr:sulfotransferase [Vicinamibacterales bacterium]